MGQSAARTDRVLQDASMLVKVLVALSLQEEFRDLVSQTPAIYVRRVVAWLEGLSKTKKPSAIHQTVVEEVLTLLGNLSVDAKVKVYLRGLQPPVVPLLVKHAGIFRVAMLPSPTTKRRLHLSAAQPLTTPRCSPKP